MKPIHLLFCALCFFTLVPLPVRLLLAQPPSSGPAVVVNFDRRESRPGGSSARKALAGAEAALKAQLPAVQVERHPFTGSAQFISSPRGFLTGPKGAGLAAGTAARALPESDGLRGLKAFLRSHRAVVGHGEEVLNSAAVERDYVDAHNGLRTVILRQQVGGIPVFEGLLKSHVTRAGELVNLGSGFVADPKKAADKGLPNRAQALAMPKINARKAVALAAAELGEVLEESSLAAKSKPVDPVQKQQFQHPALGDLSVQYVWLPVDAETLRLCWQIILTSKKRGEMFRVLVDAETGSAWLLHNLTHNISAASYRVFTEDSPTPMSPGLSVPGTAQPPEVARVLVTTPALSQTASPNGWINDGANETRGNNVEAHTDLTDNDLPDLPRPQGAPFRVFDPPLDLSKDPSTYRNAAVVNLFYLCNVVHDRLYDLGFTEAAGNFQSNNFGRGGLGGLGGDAVQADAQDGSTLKNVRANNANFSTPPDGGAGRMQMYLWTGPNPRRDGSLDASIVIHEYVHGLSDRLVGGGIGISALQTIGMGEGWSDFYALCLLAKPGDDPGGNYPVGAYATYRFEGLEQNYYFGIRRYPYSTNPGVNPLTFKDIAIEQASMHEGVPINPLDGEIDPEQATQVHNMGEIWCTALWEVRANLIAKHGFDVGNQLSLQLVTDGMKLAPANPNFLQARNAILQADLVGSAGANRDEIWAGFAKRGMGMSAASPASSSTAGLIEAFDLPSDLKVTDSPTIFEGPRGGSFAPASDTFTLTNHSEAPRNWAVTQSPAWLTLSPSSGTLAAGGTVTVTATPNAAAVGLPLGVNTGRVEFKNLTTGATKLSEVKLLCGGPEYFTELFSAADNYTDNQSFTFLPQDSSSGYALSRNNATVFPVAPAGGTVLTLGNNNSVKVDLADGKQVRLYGKAYSSFYVGSNGYITFTAGDSANGSSFASHFALPRVAALMADLDPSNLNPNSGKFVSWKQLPDRAVVTWSGVPTRAQSDSNSFQIELFFDGRIRITLLALGNSGGLIGLSFGGGTPANLVESNFSAYPQNQPPTISAIPNQSLEKGTATGELAFTVGDAETAAGTLTVSAAAQNSALVPAAGLILSGTGANRTLKVVPLPSGSGSTEVFVTVTDNFGASSSTSFTLAVNAQAPLIDPVANVLLVEDATTAPVPLALTGIRSGNLAAPLLLTVTANSSRPDLLSDPVVQYTTGGTGATLLLTPKFAAAGVALVTVTVSDGRPENGTTTISFQVEIRLRNYAPSFQGGSDQVTLEDSGLQSVPQWATEISPGRAIEAGQVVNFELIHDAPGLFSVPPSLSADGTLTYRAAPEASGTATVQVRLRDNGGTNDGGVDASAPQTLRITINPVNDAPSFAPGANVNVPLGTLAHSVPGWASQVRAGPPNEGTQGLTFFVEAEDKRLFSVQPAVSASGTLTFTPAPKVSGDTVVYIRLEDNGGTAFGGVSATSTAQFKIVITTNVNQVGGEFNGLIEPVVLPATSTRHLGLAKITIGRGGNFSGNLRLGVINYPIRGRFDESGVARFGRTSEPQLTILRKGLPALVVALQVDVVNGTGKLLGTIAEGPTPVALINTDRLLYSAAKAPKSPQVKVPSDVLGVSTVAFAPAATLPPAAFPQGYGIGVLTVAASGRTTLVGKLADGSPISYSNAVSIGKKFPVYTTYSLPKGGVGTLAGWVPLDNPTQQDDFLATLSWFRPATNSATYPAGWPTGIPVQVQGSRWFSVAPTGGPKRFPGVEETNFSGNILMKFSKGLLPGAGFQARANLTDKNAILPVRMNPRSLSSGSIGATGLFSGRFSHPVTGARPRFEAVVLQKRKRAVGFFLSPQESGAVQVEPR